MPAIKSDYYKRPWHQRENYHEIMESWINAASLVVNASGIIETHKKKLLDTIVWKATESQGSSKYNTRFVSESIYVKNVDLLVDIQFEHVRPKEKVIADLLKTPQNIRATLYNAAVCTVTTAEHKNLQDGEDWDRYRKAGINVYDRKENKLVTF